MHEPNGGPTRPAAGSPLTRDLLFGNPQPATVLAAFPTALYLHLDGAVLPVLASDALLLPTGLRLAVPSEQLVWPVGCGGAVTVGAGHVRLPGLDVAVVREWRPGAVASGRWAATADQQAAHDVLPDGGVLAELCADLTRVALAGDDVRPAVAGLLGAGPGLTPSGDDAVCGVLLTLRAGLGTSRPLHQLVTVVRGLLHRTTSLSASLLRAAGEGHAVPEVLRLFERPDTARVGAVLRIGHTSGGDLLAGVDGALRALATIDLTRHRPSLEGAHRG